MGALQATAGAVVVGCPAVVLLGSGAGVVVVVPLPPDPAAVVALPPGIGRNKFDKRYSIFI